MSLCFFETPQQDGKVICGIIVWRGRILWIWSHIIQDLMREMQENNIGKYPEDTEYLI